VTNIRCDDFVIGGASVALSPPATVGATLSGVGVSCAADWSFRLHSWPHVPDGSGSADISVSQTSATLALGVNASAATLRPTVAASGAALSIGAVSITLHGSALDWLLDLFKSELERAIRSALDGAFPPVLEKFIDVDANAALARIPVAVPIDARAPYNVSEARFGFTSAPAATSAFLAFGVQGDVVPLGFAGAPPVPAPALPAFDASAAGFAIEGRFSAYTLTSAAWTYFSSGLTTWPIAPRDVPLGLNETGGYALIAPGLAKAYAPDTPVRLLVALAAVPALAIAPPAAGGIAAAAQLTVSFFAGDAPAFALDVAAAFGLDVGVAPSAAAPGSLVFNGTLAFVSANVTLGSTAVGPVAVGLLQALVDVVLPLAAATLNGDLARGFPLPPIDGLAFTNATSLQLMQGYALFAADFTFAPTR
jgi:hypothetical protein